MARHLYIGNAATAAYTSGVMADGAIDIQKLSATGPTSMTLLDTIQTAPQFRVVQGNGTTNIVSPWIYGKDVINYSGKAYSAPVSQISRITWSADATNAANVEGTIKFINTTNGNTDPFDAKSYTIANIGTNSGNNTQQEIARLFFAELYSDYSGSGSQSAVQSEDLPWFVKSVPCNGVKAEVITIVNPLAKF